MIPLNQIHVVEFSTNQECCHLETLDEMLKANLLAINEMKAMDYIPIGFFDNYESASKFIEWHEKINPFRLKTIEQ